MLVVLLDLRECRGHWVQLVWRGQPARPDHKVRLDQLACKGRPERLELQDQQGRREPLGRSALLVHRDRR